MKITIPNYWPFTLTVPGLSLITLVPSISMRNGVLIIKASTTWKGYHNLTAYLVFLKKDTDIICGAWVYKPMVLAKGPLLSLIWTVLEHRMWWNPSLTTQP